MASKIANAGKHTILKEMIKRAMQEDEQALQYLDVEDSYVTPKSDLPPEWVGMKCDYRETVALYMAAKKLGMQRYQSMSRNYLRCMRQLARIKFNKEFPEDSYSVEREDILEEMALMSCHPFPEQLNRTLFQQEINEEFRDSDDDEDIIPPTPRKKKLTSQDSDEDPTPTQESDEDPTSKTPRKKKLTSQDSDEDPTPKTPRKRKLTSQDSDEDSTPKRPTTKKLTSQDSHEDSTPKRKRSHHSQVKCKVPGCKFHGQDINRHLRTHVKKGELEAENIEAMAELCQHGKRQRGPAFRPANTKTQSAMTQKKWCTMENCTTVTSCMDKHSRNVHKLSKDSVEYRVKLKAAKPDSGLGEVHALVKDREESLGEGKEPSEEDLPVLLSEAGEDVTKPADTSRGKDDEDDGQKEEDNEHDVDENDDDDEERDEDDEDNEDDDEDDEDNEDREDDEYHEDDEDNEDDDNVAKIKSQPGALEYYTATKYDDNRHQWLCGFYRYLGLPDAGYKKHALKLKHLGQVKLLLAALDKDGDDITVLGEEQGHAVWSRWVDP